jgi:hypothetical protein
LARLIKKEILRIYRNRIHSLTPVSLAQDISRRGFSMGISLDNIKLLAFVVAFKRHRRNSIFYRNERKYLTAKIIGVSVNTFSKYFLRLKELGLLSESNGVIVISKLSECIKLLLNKEGQEFKAFRYAAIPKQGTYKGIYASIQKEIFKLNISSQEYRISRILRAKNLLEANRNNVREFNFVRRVQSQYGGKLSSINESNLYPKSGKFHTSKLFGCSPSTGLKRLRNWNRDGIIKREVVTKELLHVNHASFDLLKQHYKHILINHTTGKFYAQVGSKVSIL